MAGARYVYPLGIYEIESSIKNDSPQAGQDCLLQPLPRKDLQLGHRQTIHATAEQASVANIIE